MAGNNSMTSGRKCSRLRTLFATATESRANVLWNDSNPWDRAIRNASWCVEMIPATPDLARNSMAAVSRASPASKSMFTIGSLPTSRTCAARVPMINGVPNRRKTIFEGEAQAAPIVCGVRTEGITRDCSNQFCTSASSNNRAPGLEGGKSSWLFALALEFCLMTRYWVATGKPCHDEGIALLH